MPFARADGCNIYYEEAGAGEVVILLPGLGHDHTYYEKTVPLLTPFARVITMDPRGLGQSTTEQTEYSVEEWARDLVSVMDATGAQRAHLVGSSLGACVVLQAALDFPDRVASVCSVAGFSELDRSLELNFRMRINVIQNLGLGDVLASHIAMWTLGRSFINTPEGQAAVDRLFASVRRNSPERYLAFIRAILAFGRLEPGQQGQQGQQKMTERLGNVKVPACVVVGEQDILTPVFQSQQLADRIPNAEMHVIAGCGHITFSEKPRETAAVIEQFLRKCVRG